MTFPASEWDFAVSGGFEYKMDRLNDFKCDIMLTPETTSSMTAWQNMLMWLYNMK